MSEDGVPLLPEIEEGTWVAARVAFTGFKMHLRTCRFKFDATPNRRPQVSHTNAAKTRNGRNQPPQIHTLMMIISGLTLFTSVHKQML
jgi:hypothetical protein